MKTTSENNVVRTVPPGRKAIAMKDGTARAKVARAMLKPRTFDQIARSTGLTVEQVKAHVVCNHRDKGIGYVIDTQGKITALLPKAVDRFEDLLVSN